MSLSIKNFDALIESQKKAAIRKAKREEKAALLGHKKKAKKRKSKSRRIIENGANGTWPTFAKNFRDKWRDKYGSSLCFLNDICGGLGTDAGHIISRRKRATKYDERNLVLLCRNCNWSDSNQDGYHDVLVARFCLVFGFDLYDELVWKSRELCQQDKMDMFHIGAIAEDEIRVRGLTLL